MAEISDMKARDLLEQVNTAITTVLVGGQSYKIGSRSLTRADLALLRSMKSDLEAAPLWSTLRGDKQHGDH